MAKSNEPKYLNRQKSKKAVVLISTAVALAISAAIAVPLGIVLSREEKQQPPINGRYYSLLGDDKRFETVSEAQAYLRRLSSKPQVYKFEGQEYTTTDRLLAAMDDSDANFIRDNVNFKSVDSPILPVAFNASGTIYGGPGPLQPNNGTPIEPSWTKPAGVQIGYYFDESFVPAEGDTKFIDNVYYSLNEAHEAWLDWMHDNNHFNKVEEVVEVQGNADVIMTNTNYSGKFNIPLTSPTTGNANDVLSKLSWGTGVNSNIKGNSSVATISLADSGTTAYFVDEQDPVNKKKQQISFDTAYSPYPINMNKFSLEMVTPFTPGVSSTSPLITTLFQTYSTPSGWEYDYSAIKPDDGRFAGQIFPHMEGTTFVEGNCSKADVATYFDGILKALPDGSTATIDSNDNIVRFVIDGSNFSIDLEPVLSKLIAIPGWESVNLMENLNDTADTKKVKALVVEAMIRQEMLVINQQSTITTSPATPATYRLTLPAIGSEPIRTFDLVGPQNGTELTLSSFISTINGGTEDVPYTDYELQYNSQPTGIKTRLWDQSAQPAPITLNDFAIDIKNQYIAPVEAIPYTTNDAPAIQSETYDVVSGQVLSPNTPIAKSQMLIEKGTFAGYSYDNKFYQTFLDASNVMLSIEHPRPTIRLEDTSTDAIIVFGNTYSSFTDAYGALIYFVDWVGSPDALPLTQASNSSRELEDLYTIA